MMTSPLTDSLNRVWKQLLADEFQQPYWRQLEDFVAEERQTYPGQIYPPAKQVFAAYNFVAPEQVRVVLLGQDPYHGAGQAHGLSFSVAPRVKLPPSLKNIFAELQTDLGVAVPESGSLESWAKQGIMLLNTVLTVRHKEANSHRKQGWERFTDQTIGVLSELPQPLVFLLWGGPARKKKQLIDESRHRVIEMAHPSPLSAHNGFFGTQPFSRVNTALSELGHNPINWNSVNED